MPAVCWQSSRSLLTRQAKLAEAENAELALRKERRTLEEEKQRLELEIERRLQAERLRIRAATQKEEEQNYLLKLAEKDKVISDMKTQVEELRRKSEQGSQQLQGEVLELELEAMLRTAFPADQIEPVAKGRQRRRHRAQSCRSQRSAVRHDFMGKQAHAQLEQRVAYQEP